MRISRIGQNHLGLLENHRKLLTLGILALPGCIVNAVAGAEATSAANAKAA